MKTFFRFVPLFLLILALGGLGYLGFLAVTGQNKPVTDQEVNPFEESGVSVVEEVVEVTPTPSPTPTPDAPEEEAEETQLTGDTAALLDPAVAETLSGLSVEQKVDQLFFLTPEALLAASSASEGEEVTEAVTRAGGMTKQAIQEHPVGGIFYARENLVGEDQTKELLANTKEYYKNVHRPEPFLAVVEEGGAAVSIGGRTELYQAAATASAAEVGATGDPAAATQQASVIGGYLKSLGFNMNFAPCADIWTNGDNTWLSDRAFSGDAEVVRSMAEAYAASLSGQGIKPVWKHFPGLGNAAGSSPTESSTSDVSADRLHTIELYPYENAVETAPCIMVGHISLPQVIGKDTPASLAPEIVTDILRNEYQYDGLVITDALNAAAISSRYEAGEAAILALEAGCDMLYAPADYPAARKAVLEAIADGRITEERLNTSVARILYAKQS